MNAYVVFKDKSSVQKAVLDNGIICLDHHLRIDYAAQNSDPKASHSKGVAHNKKKSLFVGNLPLSKTFDFLFILFLVF
jgi:RNA recognition motif-containing protein